MNTAELIAEITTQEQRAEHLEKMADTAYGRSDLQTFTELRTYAAACWVRAGRAKAVLAER